MANPMSHIHEWRPLSQGPTCAICGVTTSADQPPVLTLDEAGVERLAEAEHETRCKHAGWDTDDPNYEAHKENHRHEARAVVEELRK